MARFDLSLIEGMNARIQSPAAVVVYVTLLILGANKKAGTEASLQTIADRTGISKSAVQDAAALLVKAGYVSKAMSSPTATPVWKLRPSKLR